MTTSSTSQRLRARAHTLWEAQIAHPFVRGIGDGTLPPELFGHWLKQDYLYLIDYGRVFAFAAARAPDLATMRAFTTLLHETLETEMALHRSYVAGFGITIGDLEATRKAPTTQGYTDFLLRLAATADYPELIAALLPCMWGYSDLGQRLAARGRPAEERYARWIDMYASPEFAQLAAWCCDLLDRVCLGASPDLLARVEEAFVTSVRYEHAFWEMSWTLEDWPDATTTGDAMLPAPIDLRDPVTGATARIHPAVGFNCASFVAVIDGAPVETLWSEPDFVASGAGKSTRSGIPLLFPFAGRIGDASYTWEGRTYPLTTAGRSDANAIHGFVVDRPWRVIALAADRAEAEFQGSIDAPETLAEWPSDYRIRVAYALEGNALHCDVRIDNPGDAALPFGFGTHPYFRVPLGGGDADACRVTVPALEFWPLADMLPTGERLPVDAARDLRHGVPFRDIQVDDVLSSLIASDGAIVATVLDPTSGIEVRQSWTMAFPHCVVYTAPARESIAIEPYTTAPDAFRLRDAGIDPDLVVLQPGEAWHVRITIAVARAAS